MSRIDLDAIQARYDAWSDPSPVDGELDDIEIETRTWKSAKDVPDLVAELRAAQAAHGELRELATDLDATDLTAAAAHRLRSILDRWEEATP